MEHTVEFVSKFASKSEEAKRKKFKAVNFNMSGHVIATNAYTLFASKTPYDFKRTGKTYCSESFCLKKWVEVTTEFLNIEDVIPNESSLKLQVDIPKWFSKFEGEEEQVIFSLNYQDVNTPYFKITYKLEEREVSVDARFLSLFAGGTYLFLVYGPEDQIVMIDKSSKIDPKSLHLREDILNEEWFYLLMPVRMEKKVKEKEVLLS